MDPRHQRDDIQYAHSNESDFLSRGVSVSHTSEINQRNTGLSAGMSYTDDRIQPAFFSEERERDTYDFFVGLSQIINPRTVASVNYTRGDVDGYTSDPYKLIEKETEVAPNIVFPLTFAENRPDQRHRDIWLLGLKRHFATARGSLDISYRNFEDDWGVESHTFDLAWFQRIGEKLILRPNVRLYQQNAADFYRLTLTGTDIVPLDEPTGLAPYYSADYRLAKLKSYTFGMKAIYTFNERFALDAQYERYEMRGNDGFTPASAFPAANIITLGGTTWF